MGSRYLGPMFALRLPAFHSIAFGAPHVARGLEAANRPSDTAAVEPAAERVPPPTHASDARPSGAAVHADPYGIRVVPLRPDSSWPLRRGRDRVASPFRAFPYRSLHLSRMMAPVDPRD